MFKLIHRINMHTFVYQFERSVIDHYERISLYILYGDQAQIACISFFYGPAYTNNCENST